MTIKLCKDCKHWSRSSQFDTHPYGKCNKAEYSIDPVWGTESKHTALFVRGQESLCGFKAVGWEAKD